MRRLFERLLKNQDGSIAVVAALSMTALLGFSAFVLDFGVYYSQAGKLQNALDSAVLAGVQELPSTGTADSSWSQAVEEAVSYMAFNGFSISSDAVAPIYDTAASRVVGLRITDSVIVEYAFAKVFGVNSGTATRTAAAQVTPAGGITGAVPLSITESSLSAAIASGHVSDLIIKCSSNTSEIGIDSTGESGWFGALRFDGTGASTYSYLLSYGYSGALQVGQVLDMESGNMSGPTMDGFITRYNRCTDGCTADDHLPNCPRLVYIPVVEVVGSKQVKIVGFSTFFLTECGGSGNDSYIKATYIPDNLLPNAVPGQSGEDFGVYVCKLLD